MKDRLVRPSRSLYYFIGIVATAYGFSYIWTSLAVPWFLKGIGSLSWQPLLLNVVYALLIGALAVYAIKAVQLPFSYLGAGASQVREASWIIVIGWVVLFAILIPFNLNGIGMVNWDPLTIIGQWFFASMAEELFFRGYIQAQLSGGLLTLKKPWDIILSFIITNVIFATFRLPSLMVSISQSAGNINVNDLALSLLIYFGSGLVFSYLYYRTRNIILVGLLHGGWVTQAADSPIKSSVFFLVFILVVEGYLLFRRLRTKKGQGVRRITKTSHRRAG